MNLGRRQVPHEALFHHERREGAEMPMPHRTAVHRVQPVDGAIVAPYQPLFAAGAGHVFPQRMQWVMPVGMQRMEQRQHTIGGKLHVLPRIEPDAMAVEAQVDADGFAIQPFQRQRLHGLAAGGAGQAGCGLRTGWLYMETCGLSCRRCRQHRPGRARQGRGRCAISRWRAASMRHSPSIDGQPLLLKCIRHGRRAGCPCLAAAGSSCPRTA